MNKVYLYKAANYEDKTAISTAVENILNASAAFGALEANANILIKPNLLTGNTPQACVTTHPAVLRAVILALQARGYNNITVADSSGGPASAALMRAVYRRSGLEAVCIETGVQFYVDANGYETPCDGKVVRTFTLLEPLRSAPFVINLPKFKTHMLTTVSGAVKNLFGCVPGLLKAEFHTRFTSRELFGEMLVDLAQLIKPQLTIMDAVMGMEGDGPAGGEPRLVGLIIGGENIYNIDLVVTHLMGIEPAAVPTIVAAEKRGLAPARASDDMLEGDVKQLYTIAGYKPPKSYARINTTNMRLSFMAPAITKIIAPKPKILKKKCIGCGRCAEICAAGAVKVVDDVAKIDYTKCIKCFCCHEICPAKAIDMKRIGLFNI